MKNLLVLLSLTCFLMASACSGKKAVKYDACTMEGRLIMEDDGCNMFQAITGEVYEIKTWASTTGRGDGNIWKVGYRVLEGKTSSCEGADGVIEMGCASVLSTLPECKKVIAVNKLPWIDKMVKAGEVNRVRVTSAGSNENLFYLTDSGKDVQVYDCNGKFITTVKESELATLNNLGLNVGKMFTLYESQS